MRALRNAVVILIVVGSAGWLAWSRWKPPEVVLAAPTRGPAIDAVYATGLVEPTLFVAGVTGTVAGGSRPWEGTRPCATACSSFS